MEGQRILFAAVIIFSLGVSCCHGEAAHRPFSSMVNNTLVVVATSKKGELLAGVDTINITWGPNPNPTADAASLYKTVKVKLCYTTISQTDRPWRKTHLDNLAKDKTCQFVMFAGPYVHKNSSKTYLITKEIPGAIYFVRVYAFNETIQEIAYAETPRNGTDFTFNIVGITGRTTSIDIAASVFSAFSVLSLVYFFFMEKRKSKMAVDADGS